MIQRQWWAAFGAGLITLLLLLSVDLCIDDLERAMDGFSDGAGRP